VSYYSYVPQAIGSGVSGEGLDCYLQPVYNFLRISFIGSLHSFVGKSGQTSNLVPLTTNSIQHSASALI